MVVWPYWPNSNLNHEEYQDISKELRTNEKIKVREVRLVDEEGRQLGVLPIQKALDLAQSRNLDLVEVAPNASPPVCKLLDFGRYKYEQTKKEREARKSQKQLVLKEIWFRPNVDEHDRMFKTKMIQKFLEEGDKVKVTVRFRGRELAHPERARILLNTVAEDIKPYANIEKLPLMDGKSMTMIVSPSKSLLKPAGTPAANGEPSVAPPAPSSNGQAHVISQPVRAPAPAGSQSSG